LNPQESNLERLLLKSVSNFFSHSEVIRYYPDRAREVGLWPHERAMFQRFLEPPPTVLDVGCGARCEAVELARWGFSVVGIDIAEPLLENARALALELGLSIPFEVTDGAKLDFAGRSFDYVTLTGQMIHHVPLRKNRIQLLREPGRVVRSGGAILLTYHDWGLKQDHQPWRSRQPASRGGEELLEIAEPGDRLVDECEGAVTESGGFVHNLTKAEMELEVADAGLLIRERARISTVAGGEPNDYWKPTRILVLEAGTATASETE